MQFTAFETVRSCSVIYSANSYHLTDYLYFGISIDKVIIW